MNNIAENVDTGDGFEDMFAALGEKYWGKYLTNRFFIHINTQKKRSDVPSYDFDDASFSEEDQLQLQRENYPAIFHEYIHYIHEVTTMAGATNFYYQFVNRVYFSMYAVETTGSTYPIIDKEMLKMMNTTKLVLASLDGGNLHNIESLLIIKMTDVHLQDFYAQLPNLPSPLKMKIPVVSFMAFNKESKEYTNEELFLGKFYLYEGIAHNIDRIIQTDMGREPGLKSKISAEYLVMEKLAYHIVPNLEMREMLEIATLSLSYLNCGEYFIAFLNQIAKSKDRSQTLKKLKEETSGLLKEKFSEFKDSFEGLIGALRGRKPLINAVGYLAGAMIGGMESRIENPVFEIDVVYSKRYSGIQNYLSMCPMMYEFNEDDDIFRRDYPGTYLGELGSDMLTLLCNLDYYYAAMAKLETHRCPLYTACSHPLRKENGPQCKSEPRLAYEVKDKFGWCHYGLGVAYTKHIDQDAV